MLCHNLHCHKIIWVDVTIEEMHLFLGILLKKNSLSLILNGGGSYMGHDILCLKNKQVELHWGLFFSTRNQEFSHGFASEIIQEEPL
jgi:hypothetical protein